LSSTISVAALTAVVAGGAILVFALEGAVCLLIVFPLAFMATLAGALIGRAIASSGAGTPAQALLVVLLLPFLAGVGQIQTRSSRSRWPRPIDATPRRWEHVIGFSELAARRAVFRTGSPTAARSTAAASARCATASSRLARPPS
jgi:hypothetical protein